MLDELKNLDRWLLLTLNGSSSLYFDGLAKTLTTATTWIPLYLSMFYMVLRNNNSFRKVIFVLFCAALCYLLSGAVDDGIVKPLVARWRPTHDPVIGWQVDVVNGYRGGNYGFFSAHACNTFSIAVFFSLLVRSRFLSVSLILWSLVNCWTRLYLGVHFPGDILCGILWGGLVGTVVYYLFIRVEQYYSNGMKYVSSYYTKTGYQYSDIDVVVSVFVFTFLYALLRACLALYI